MSPHISCSSRLFKTFFCALFLRLLRLLFCSATYLFPYDKDNSGYKVSAWKGRDDIIT